MVLTSAGTLQTWRDQSSPDIFDSAIPRFEFLA